MAGRERMIGPNWPSSSSVAALVEQARPAQRAGQTQGCPGPGLHEVIKAVPLDKNGLFRHLPTHGAVPPTTVLGWTSDLGAEQGEQADDAWQNTGYDRGGLC